MERKFTLKQARLLSGLKQREVAKKVGLNVGTISEYETHKSFPRVDTAKRLADLYGIEFDEFNFFNENIG